MQKNTKNAVLLSDLGGLDGNDIQFLEDNLSSLGIELGRITTERGYINYFEDFSLQTFFVFSPSFLSELINHKENCEIWQSIKRIITYTQNKLSGQSYRKEIRGLTILRPITFGIHMILDVNTTYNFELSSISDNRLLDGALDKTLSFLVHQTPNKNYELPSYVRFSTERKHWEAETFEQYLLNTSMSN